MPRYGYGTAQVRFGGPLTPGVKTIIIANMAAFLLQVIVRPFTEWFALQPPQVLPWNFQIWRVGTYMFLHFGTWHLFWNMLSLFLFGGAIESTWGTRSFYRYYFLCGLGGALFAFIPIGAFTNVSIAGASGAVYGILLAYGVLFPNNKIYVLLTFPVEAKYLVAFVGFISLVSALTGQEGVAHTVHLGGFLTGFVLLRWAGLARGSSSFARSDLLGSLRDAFRRWRLKRLKRKFEVYYEKRANQDDRDIIH